MEGLRNPSLRPPQNTISRNREALLAECLYFAIDDLALRLRGHTCPFDLLPSCRLLQFDEAEGNATLLDVFEQHLTRKERGSLQLPLLLDYPRKDLELAPSLLQCKARLDEITGGLLGEMIGDPAILGAVVVAGGSVTAALTGCAAGAAVWPVRTPLLPSRA